MAGEILAKAVGSVTVTPAAVQTALPAADPTKLAEAEAQWAEMIRAEAEKRFGSEAADSLQILYGGSVKPDNIDGLMAEPEIDGALVGGASLDANSFSKIVKAA